jgi:hypothetical protein
LNIPESSWGWPRVSPIFVWGSQPGDELTADREFW